MIFRRRNAGHQAVLVMLFMLGGTGLAGAAAGAGELLLVERPARLVVLNRYQQNVTAAEKAFLQPFVPMTVVKKNDMLGDGFTPCTRVQIAGQEFFLVREGSGRLVGEAQAGRITQWEGTFQAGDTVSVLRGGTLRFTPAGGPLDILLGAGERLVRIFSRARQTYVRRSGGTQPFGWVDFTASTEGREWALLRLAPSAPSVVPPRIAEVVSAAVARTNAKLSGLFTFFNARSTSQKTTPRWDMAAEGTVLRCTLRGGSTERDFPESTRYLIRDIQDKIPGSGFRVFLSTDGFEVRPD